jgi:hypothetical protein
MSSIASPLLYLSSSTRPFVTRLIVHPQPTPQDIVCRLVHSIALSRAPLLAVNLWFLLRVTQVGMGPLNWLSLVTNALAIVHLCAQAVREWRKETTRPMADGVDQMIDLRTAKFESDATAGLASTSGSTTGDRLGFPTDSSVVVNAAKIRGESESEMAALGP